MFKISKHIFFDLLLRWKSKISLVSFIRREQVFVPPPGFWTRYADWYKPTRHMIFDFWLRWNSKSTFLVTSIRITFLTTFSKATMDRTPTFNTVAFHSTVKEARRRFNNCFAPYFELLHNKKASQKVGRTRRAQMYRAISMICARA